MVNYQDGKIYKVVCDETGMIYYGSTTQPLYKRAWSHRNNNGCMTKDMTNPKIYLVEDYPCERKEQLLMRERYYIDNNECCNKLNPIRTIEEKKAIRKKCNHKYCNSENGKSKKREWEKEHREEINKARKERRAILPTITCECGSTYKRDKARHLKSKKHQSYISNLS